MALALPLLAHLFEPVQGMVHWLAGGAPASTTSAVSAASTPLGVGEWRDTPGRGVATPHEANTHRARPAASQRAWGGPTRSSPLQRPLRVVRVLEGRADCAAAGRMVISGRMADVCAELDRLADLETRH